MLKGNPSLDLQGHPLAPVQFDKFCTKIAVKYLTNLISVLTVDDNIELEGSDDSGCENPDTAITRPVKASHSESKPGLVVSRLGRVISLHRKEGMWYL